jgi:hypothetical protein
MQLLCQRNSLDLRSFTVQEIAELSEILTVQKNDRAKSLFPQKQLNREEGRLLRVVENAIQARTVVEGSDWTEPDTFEKKWG